MANRGSAQSFKGSRADRSPACRRWTAPPRRTREPRPSSSSAGPAGAGLRGGGCLRVAAAGGGSRRWRRSAGSSRGLRAPPYLRCYCSVCRKTAGGAAMRSTSGQRPARSRSRRGRRHGVPRHDRRRGEPGRAPLLHPLRLGPVSVGPALARPRPPLRERDRHSLEEWHTRTGSSKADPAHTGRG
jgi:hypothetical protein